MTTSRVERHKPEPCSCSDKYVALSIVLEYCFGDDEVLFDILSDQSVNFHGQNGVVNFQDENLNISLPIFSIHGNHDDPSGDGGYAALDLLSVCGLVNYFGKHLDVDDVSCWCLANRYKCHPS